MKCFHVYHSCGLIGILVIFLIALGVLFTKTKIIICASNSLQGVRVLLVLKGSSYKRDDIVAIEGHPVDALSHQILAKRVIGMRQDSVIREGESLRVGTTRISPLLSHRSDGKALTPLQDQIIPEGYVFVAGDHLRSFDSRYQEFGFVSQNNIIGRAIPLW